MIDKIVDVNINKTNESKSLNKEQSVSDDTVEEFELELEKETDDKISKSDPKSDDKPDDESEDKDALQILLDSNQRKIVHDKNSKNKEIDVIVDKQFLMETAKNKEKPNNEVKSDKDKLLSHQAKPQAQSQTNAKENQTTEKGKFNANDIALNNDENSSHNIKKHDFTPGGAILSNVNTSSATASEKMALISTVIEKINSAEGIGKNNVITISIDKGHFIGLEIDIKVEKGTLSISFNYNASQFESLQQLMPELSERLNKLNQDQEVKLVMNDISDDQSEQYSKSDSDDSESKHQDDIIDEWLEEQRGD